MAKYIFFTDAHAKGKNPSRRTDDYFQSWMIKYREMFALAKKHKVAGILNGGDLLDIPNISDSVIDEILDVIEESGIPMYSCWGNHEEIGHNKANSKGSSLSHMFKRCKLFIETEHLEDDHAYIKFVDYEHNVETNLKENGFKIDISADKWKVGIIHAFITPKPFRPDVLHIVADDIKTNADLILVGHYHAPWQKQVGSTDYLDIGSFGRTSIHEINIEPSCLLLDTKKRSYEIIKMKKAKTGLEVFDVSKKENEESNAADLETFIESLRDFKGQATDIRGTIEYIAKENNVDRKVINIILEKLIEVENATSKS